MLQFADIHLSSDGRTMARSEAGVTHRLSRRIQRKQTEDKYSTYIAISMYTYPPSNFSLLDFLLFYSYRVSLLQTVLNNTTKSSLFSEDVSWRHSSVTSKNSTSLFKVNKQNKGEGQKGGGGTCVKSIREFLTNESRWKKSEVKVKEKRVERIKFNYWRALRYMCLSVIIVLCCYYCVVLLLLCCSMYSLCVL